MAFSTNFKRAKGTAYMESKGRRADRVNAEQAALQAALKRDHRKCRWPNCTGKFRGLTLPIDPAHIFVHRGMGGDKLGTRTAQNLICGLCREHHRQLDADEIQIQAMDASLADGCLAFYVKDPETGVFVHIATEVRCGVSEPRR